MIARTPVPRVEVIEGRRALVIERRPPLPSSLDRLVSEMAVTYHTPIHARGWRAACEGQEHRLLRFMEGRHRGLDGVSRDLRLLVCADCAAVCVRDITYDRLLGLPPSSLAARRRDHVIGWYAGARRNQRLYR